MHQEEKFSRYEERLNIPIIYRTNFFTAALLGWVSAQRQMNVTIIDAVKSFQQYMGVPDEDPQNLARVYHYKNNQLRAEMKNGAVRFSFIGFDEIQEISQALDEIRSILAKYETGAKDKKRPLNGKKQ